MKYTILVQWSDEDQCHAVSLPEWGKFCHTHGETYEEAFQNAQEVLDMLVESALPTAYMSVTGEGKPLLEPQTFGKTLQTA